MSNPCSSAQQEPVLTPQQMDILCRKCCPQPPQKRNKNQRMQKHSDNWLTNVYKDKKRPSSKAPKTKCKAKKKPIHQQESLVNSDDDSKVKLQQLLDEIQCMQTAERERAECYKKCLNPEETQRQACPFTCPPSPPPQQSKDSSCCDLLDMMRSAMEEGVKESVEEVFRRYFSNIMDKVDLIASQLMRNEYMLTSTQKALVEKMDGFGSGVSQQYATIGERINKLLADALAAKLKEETKPPPPPCPPCCVCPCPFPYPCSAPCPCPPASTDVDQSDSNERSDQSDSCESIKAVKAKKTMESNKTTYGPCMPCKPYICCKPCLPNKPKKSNKPIKPIKPCDPCVFCRPCTICCDPCDICKVCKPNKNGEGVPNKSRRKQGNNISSISLHVEDPKGRDRKAVYSHEFEYGEAVDDIASNFDVENSFTLEETDS